MIPTSACRTISLGAFRTSSSLTTPAHLSTLSLGGSRRVIELNNNLSRGTSSASEYCRTAREVARISAEVRGSRG